MIRAIGRVRWVAKGCEVRTEDTDELVAVAASDGLAKLMALAPELLAYANQQWSTGHHKRAQSDAGGTLIQTESERIDQMLAPIGGAPAWVVQETETRQLTGTGA